MTSVEARIDSVPSLLRISTQTLSTEGDLADSNLYDDPDRVSDEFAKRDDRSLAFAL